MAIIKNPLTIVKQGGGGVDPLTNFREYQFDSLFRKNSTIAYFICSNGDILASAFAGVGQLIMQVFIAETETVTTLSSTRRFYAFQEMSSGNVLCTTDTGVCIYDLTTHTLSAPTAGSSYSRLITVLSDGYICHSLNDNNFTYVDDETETRTYISTTSYNSRASYIIKTENGALFSSNNAALVGVFYFKESDLSITNVYSTGRNYMYGTEIPDGALFASSTSAITGLFNFEESTLTVTQVFANNYNFNTYIKNDKGCIVLSSTSAVQYGLYFKYADKSVTQTAFTNYYYNSSRGYVVSSNNDVHIFMNNISFSALYKYSTEELIFTNIYQLGGTGMALNDGIVITSNELSARSFRYYNNATQSYSSYSTSFDNLNLIYRVSNGCLIFSSAASEGVVHFNESTKAVTSFTINNANISQAFTVGNKVYLSSSSFNGIYVYDIDENTCTPLTSSRGMSSNSFFINGVTYLAHNNSYVNALEISSNGTQRVLDMYNMLRECNGYLIGGSSIYDTISKRKGLFDGWRFNSSNYRIIDNIIYSSSGNNIIVIDCSRGD